VDIQEVFRLERINYEALVPVAEVTPGLDLVIRSDVILTSSETFPAPDTTHACLLRATPETVDALLDEVVAYFLDRDLPVTVFVSPACTPDDLGDRLLQRGFYPHEGQESWVFLDRLEDIIFYSQREDVRLHRVGPEDVLVFAETFLKGFELPLEAAPVMADMLRPSVDLPTSFHYLARFEGHDVGTISLVKHQEYGIIGSTGILPEYRRSKVVVELFRAAYSEAQQQGIKHLFAQTEINSTAERLLLTNSFRRVFVRQGYTLG
jgi:hypothetical protein